MTRTPKIALFGGTFNPIHNGHLLIAEAAKDRQKLDRVIFVPAGLPPHKKAPRTPARNRMAMVRLAIRGNPAFKASDWEVRQKRVVYTYQTLEHFRQKWPRARLFFVVGSDSMKKLPKWRESRRLRRVCRFLPFMRIAPYASHDIRRRVRTGSSIRYLVPEAVERYIKRLRLYRRPE